MSSKEKSNPKKIVGIIVGAIVFAFVSFSIQSCFTDVNAELKKVAKEMNDTMPMTVDEYTVLNRVAVTSEKQFEYYYTVDGFDIEQTNLDVVRKTLKDAIIDQMQTNPEMKVFRDYDVTLKYSYFNKQKSLVFDFKVTPEDYK